MLINERNNEIVTRYLGGESITSLASFFGISRQRIEQIYKRARVHRPRVKINISKNKPFVLPHIDEIISLVKKGYLSHEIKDKLSLPVTSKYLRSFIKVYGLRNGVWQSADILFCHTCNEEKHRSNFYSYRLSICKSCYNVKHRKYYSKS